MMRLRVPRAVAAAVLAAGLVAATFSTAVDASAAAPAVADPYAGSAQTKPGTGRFADLSVTVAKTTNLTNEAVDVTWQWGGDNPGQNATPGTGYARNIMQVFQCWGDGTEGADGPPREQCQFGGNWNPSSDYFNVTPQSGSWFDTGYLVSRTVSRGNSQRPDPMEESAGAPYRFDATVENSGIVPMRAAPVRVGAAPVEVTSATTNVFFDRTITNEVPVARTSTDGSGRTSIEMHTGQESPFLNCGQRLGVNPRGAPIARPCYLVVVPRDDVEVTGDTLPAPGRFRAFEMLGSSPLSASNWQDRIVFPLEFLPLRETCELGEVERSIIGQESLATAFLAWQSVLCRNALPLFYVSTTDDLARSNAVGSRPLLSVVSDPVSPQIQPPRGNLTYAPVGLSGVTIGFFIERRYPAGSLTPPELLAVNGSRATQMNLTPRLVAKLVTQSYGASVFSNDAPDYLLEDNIPSSLITDPEFTQVNTPADGEVDPLTDIANVSGDAKEFSTLLMPSERSDSVRQLWEWILADEDASAFLAGEPDDFGMTVNPNFEGVAKFLAEDGGPRSDFPALDESCKLVSNGPGLLPESRLCNSDANPSAVTFDRGAVLASRGQPLGSESKQTNGTTGVVSVQRPQPQFPGQRTMLALTTTASAARVGLATASLQNASGDFVAPTTASMTAAVDVASETGVPGVRRISPADVTDDAYPLTSFSYAVTNPALLDQGARDDYAAVIEYAATDGQVPGIRPGDLPDGYAPLPAAERQLALANAAAIRNYRDPVTASASPTTAATVTAAKAAASTPAATRAAGPLFGPVAPALPRSPAAAPLPGVTVPPVVTDAPPAAVEPPVAQPVALSGLSRRTDPTDVALRFILPIVLGVGLLAALVGGAFVLFGKGGMLAAPAVAVAVQAGVPPASPPSPIGAAPPPTT